MLLQWHPEISCEEHARRLTANGTDDGIGISFDSDLIKCCPMCGVPIEKDEGCAQMMCKRCKHVFCWYCLASLDVSLTCIFTTLMQFSPKTNTFWFSGWFSVAPLRQRTMQEQIGALTSISGVASSSSDWHFCWIRFVVASRIATTAIGRTVHCVLQVSDVYQRVEIRRGRNRFRWGQQIVLDRFRRRSLYLIWYR